MSFLNIKKLTNTLFLVRIPLCERTASKNLKKYFFFINIGKSALD